MCDGQRSQDAVVHPDEFDTESDQAGQYGQIQRTLDGDRMLGTVVDISDRKRLEAELRRHATEVERILESVGENFVAFDREFRYIYVNPPAAREIGARTVSIGADGTAPASTR